jgi:hypothetical protein
MIARLPMSAAFSQPKAENRARYVPHKKSFGTLARAEGMTWAGFI